MLPRRIDTSQTLCSIECMVLEPAVRRTWREESEVGRAESDRVEHVWHSLRPPSLSKFGYKGAPPEARGIQRELPRHHEGRGVVI